MQAAIHTALLDLVLIPPGKGDHPSPDAISITSIDKALEKIGHLRCHD
jgi:hypothetical protein